MKVLRKKPLCFEIEGSKISCENRLDIEFFNPEYVNSSEKIHLSIYPKVELGELIDFMTDGKHGGWNFVDNGILFLRNSNIKENYIDLSEVKYITEKDHNNVPRSHLKEGDVLLTTIGSIGLSAVVAKELEGSNINQNLVRIVLKKGKIFPEYFSIFLNSKFGRLQSERNATGNYQKMISYSTIKKFIIPLPPEKIQTEIIKVINDAKHVIGLKTNEIKEIRTANYNFFLKELQLNKPVFHDKKIFSTNIEDRLDPYYYQPKFEIIFDLLENGAFKPPKKLIELVNFSNEQIFPKKYPERIFCYIQIKDIDSVNNKILSSTTISGKDAPGRAKILIKEGDILIPLLGGSIDSISMVPPKFDNEVTSNGIAVLRIKEEYLRYFVFYYLTTDYSQLQILRNLTGSIMPSISKSSLKNILIPLPDIFTLKKITKNIKDTNSVINKLQIEIEEITAKSKEKVEKLILGKSYD